MTRQPAGYRVTLPTKCPAVNQHGAIVGRMHATLGYAAKMAVQRQAKYGGVVLVWEAGENLLPVKLVMEIR